MVLCEFNFVHLLQLCSQFICNSYPLYPSIERSIGLFLRLIVSDCIELVVGGTVFAMVIFCQLNIDKDFQACQQPRKLQIQPLS